VLVLFNHVPAQLPVFVVTPVFPKMIFPDELEMLMPVLVPKVNGVVHVKPAEAMVAEADEVVRNAVLLKAFEPNEEVTNVSAADVVVVDTVM